MYHRLIARKVPDTVRNNTTIGWAACERARANLRRMVKRVFRNRGHPPDPQAAAIGTVV